MVAPSSPFCLKCSSQGSLLPASCKSLLLPLSTCSFFIYSFLQTSLPKDKLHSPLSSSSHNALQASVCYPFTTPQSPPVSCLRVSTLFLIYSTQPCPLLHWSISFLHWPAAGLLILQQLVRFHLKVSPVSSGFPKCHRKNGIFLFNAVMWLLWKSM